jgi:hypothetical protein
VLLVPTQEQEQKQEQEQEQEQEQKQKQILRCAQDDNSFFDQDDGRAG